ncbi:hypothetical protein VTN02DRAFT_4688 [Thermoascus thermophilus]
MISGNDYSGYMLCSDKSTTGSLYCGQTLEQCILEAQRLPSSQADLCICVGKTTIDGRIFGPGHPVVILTGSRDCSDLHHHQGQ